MGERPPNKDVLLALALAAARTEERRMLPDRRSGLDRRKDTMRVPSDRRFGSERRRHARRERETPPAGLWRRFGRPLRPPVH
jgi:hypothetical protein